MNRPTLFIFSGLPATGKTTLAKALTQHFGATYVRIDTVEQALRDLCNLKVEGEGYRLSYRLAADNLRLGQSVVADSCNPIQLTRREWEEVATKNQAEFINIEVICSDKNEHRRRIETRKTDICNLKLPTWQDVVNREYDPWTGDRLIIDTAGQNITESVITLIQALTEMRGKD